VAPERAATLAANGTLTLRHDRAPRNGALPGRRIGRVLTCLLDVAHQPAKAFDLLPGGTAEERLLRFANALQGLCELRWTEYIARLVDGLVHRMIDRPGMPTTRRPQSATCPTVGVDPPAVGWNAPSNPQKLDRIAP